MKIIAITNQKGGVAKTTTAINLADGLTRLGRKVLVIDADKQCNATDTFRAKVEDQATLYDVLCAGENINNAIQHSGICDIIAADKLLADAEQRIIGQGREYRLREAMANLQGDYNYVIIDTPPDLGIMLTNALTAANACIVPVVPERYSLLGLSQLDESIGRVKKYSNPTLAVDGLLLVRFTGRFNLTKEVADLLPQITTEMGTSAFQTVIRESQATKDAQSRRLSVMAYNARSNPAKDYTAFAKEFIEREEF